jgi:hypothetical protein
LESMKKLEKRQIIILAVAALFCLYAAYELLIVGPAAKSAKLKAAAVQTESVAAVNSTDLAGYQVSAAEAYIVKKAETEWDKNPFWEKASYREFVGKEAGASTVSAVKIIYSGYMESGRKKIAIINGVEYESGEALVTEGYVSQSRVVVVNRNTGDELSVPIQE